MEIIKEESNNLTTIDKSNNVIPLSTQYYRKNKEKMREYMRNYLTKRYQNMTDEQKEKVKEYQRNRYQSMSDEQKEKLKEYRKNYYRAKCVILTKEQK